MQIELCFPFRYGIISIYRCRGPKIFRQTAQRRKVAAPMTFEFQPLSQGGALVIADDQYQAMANGGVFEFLVMEKAR